MKLFKNIKNFFRSKYYVLYELITLRLMRSLNNRVRKLLIYKGKDPDYVAPPPVPPTPAPHVVLDQEQARKRIEKAHQFASSSWMGREQWVKDPNKHPVIQARKAYEDKLNAPVVLEYEPLQVAASGLEMSGTLNTESLQEGIDFLEGIISESEK